MKLLDGKMMKEVGEEVYKNNKTRYITCKEH